MDLIKETFESSKDWLLHFVLRLEIEDVIGFSVAFLGANIGIKLARTKKEVKK